MRCVLKERGGFVITDGKKRLERVFGTGDDGKMTWWKDACESTVIGEGKKKTTE